jgi:type IV pilus assembly protein PilE
MFSKGYTLVELMVVLAIIGVITSIAYPSYQSYTCDTYISQAVGDMNVCALGMERHYSNGFSYETVPADDISVICSNVSPTQGLSKFDLALTTPTADGSDFLITATVVTGSSCGNKMTLDSLGTLDDDA